MQTRQKHERKEPHIEKGINDYHNAGSEQHNNGRRVLMAFGVRSAQAAMLNSTEWFCCL